MNNIYYEGNFINDKKSGFGSIKNLSGEEIYKGEWENDKIQGIGRINNLNCDTVVGSFTYQNFKLLNNYWKSYHG